MRKEAYGWEIVNAKGRHELHESAFTSARMLEQMKIIYVPIIF